MRSSDASLPLSNTAKDAANKTFSQLPSLPLDGPGQGPTNLADQRRLAGAFFIKIERIRPDPNQPRKTLNPLRQEELVNSVRRLGILQPISVRLMQDENIYYIIAGERRYQAAKELGLSELPCWVQRPENREVLVHQIVENWQRADLHPFDLADALTALRDTNGYTQRQLAELTGKPESEISRLLSLLKLDPDVQKEARHDASGEITRRHLIAVATLNPASQQRLYRLVKEKGLNALETETLVQETKVKAVNLDRTGLHKAERRRFKTSKAMVIIQFRRGSVTNKDILDTLGEALAQAAKDATQSNRAKE